ncbi:succinate dehydrogenase assembly factor 2 [Shimia ponticola]|uniref:succinate dehydrogenase assembly factor 2 n=1 Tax=Shimia ponticola TaxID=2582893 RepID=UPI0011BF27B1|nr:succinate dehydrogenase assembly factor 2 [Shimia ponticola]
MTETPEARVKRLYMRSIRRGIKEMDVILTKFADAHLRSLDAAELDAYEAMLAENDQDLYQWVSGQKPAPAEHAAMIDRIMSEFND